MSLTTKFALWIFIPSAIVALVNAWAFRAYPDQWGGPNIGGGILQLAAYAGMIAGVSLFVAGLVQRRRQQGSR